jgi:hypothetical protein
MPEMAAFATGKTGDPIQLSDDGMRAEVKQVDVLAEREMTYTRALFHDEAARENPGKTDIAVRMNGEAKLSFQE